MNILQKALSMVIKSHKKPIDAKNMPRDFEWQRMVMPRRETNVLENPVVYRCITLISQNIASIPLSIQSDDPIWNEILHRPNGRQKMNHMLQEIVSDMLIDGETYLVSLENSYGFYRIPPKSASEIIDELGQVAGYRYQSQKGKVEFLRDDFGNCRVLNIKYINPTGQKLSPCKIVEKRLVPLCESILDYKKAVMENMASFGGALIVKSKNGLNQTEVDEFKEKLNEHKGVKNAGHTTILYGTQDVDFKWEPMQADVRNANYSEVYEMVVRGIANAFGVPPNLLGVIDVAYNNYGQGRLFFWQDNLKPFATYVFEEISEWLSQIYSTNVKIVPDFSKVSAFAEQTQGMINVLGADCLSEDEKRNILGFNSKNNI